MLSTGKHTQVDHIPLTWCSIIPKTVIITIRVPRRVKEELEKLGIDYTREIEDYLLRRIREERARRVAEEMDRSSREIGRVDGNLAAEYTREDRDKL